MITFLFRLLLVTACLAASSRAGDRPNVLWITAEDMSPVLGCYGDEFATTPNLDALAKESIVYDLAFATAPVCSPSRSCLINGLYATSQGTQQMRSAFPIPKTMTGFPSVLRKAGYYTSNNVKTDYNSANLDDIIEASWNESSAEAHWRKKEKAQPFFSVFNLMTSHQSRAMVWPYDKFKAEVQSKLTAAEIHDPKKVPLPPYYPDTPVIRKTMARFYDCVTAMDKEVGAILKQLEEDGLADNTIVFFYSDHGSGMPRHKRALLESGMRVAMMVRIPEKFRHLATERPGTRTDRLVSFVDFGPTVLSLTNQEIPAYMEGEPFLGYLETDPRDYVFGHRDRVDEVMDLARSVRDEQYLYIRNYMPHLGYNQPTAWPDLGEIRHEFYAMTNHEALTGPQRHFMGPTRPLEELYDCKADSDNLKNLAEDKAHRRTLARMRKALARHLRDSKDLGFIPEALAWEWSKGTTPYDLARGKSAYDQKDLIDAASTVGGSSKLWLKNLKSRDPGVRYWGAVGFQGAQTLSEKEAEALKRALIDESVTVRIEAASVLVKHGYANALPILTDALEEKNLSVVLHAARTIEVLGEKAKNAKAAMEAADARMLVIRPAGTSPVVVQPDKDMAMFVGFSTKAFLKKIGE